MGSDEIYASMSKMEIRPYPTMETFRQYEYDAWMGRRSTATATSEGVARALDKIASARVMWRNGALVSFHLADKHQRGAWAERQKPKPESYISYE